MKPYTKMLLTEAWHYCLDEQKSTEFMIQYMQDYAKVTKSCVLSFISYKMRKP